MKDMMYMLMADHRTLIVFLHVISAVVWVGGMISLRFAAHHSFMELEAPERLTRVAHALKRLFTIVTPFVIILIVTAVIMAVGLGFRAAAIDVDGTVIDEAAYGIYNLVHVKEVIWMVMSANLGVMIYLRSKAEKAIHAQEFPLAKMKLGFIGKYLVPLNIVLGLIAIFLGVTLRNAY